ncbi:AtpZ/AtpI family protein [Devosia rhodophyticola]|uniref:AtpZ/AtpI family protein n=1 Tax=Devosia rhodophyticola TaxID=3026423 RepID=A0ABY7YZP3_9HYPH|nr:AtpZ/AtpI family protein [Devosia rhodophyticola]WDR06538.1 AtpZ/AtpI family protein [Devosia rhodophyticola]
MAISPDHERRKTGKSGVTNDLADRIASAKRDRNVKASQAAARTSGSSTNVGRAVRLGSEFIAAILVGTGIGFVLDQVLGTQPWIMLVMLLVGFAAGILNITRAVGDMNRAAPPPPGSDLGPDADEDDDQ